MKECEGLLGRNWKVELKHIYREANQVTDFLAKIGMQCPGRRLNVWENPPSGAAIFLQRYLMGILWPLSVLG